MAKKKEVTAKAAGTGTGTGAKTETKEKPIVVVHTKLLELFKQQDAAAEKAGSLLVEIGELVAKENISNPQLIKTIMEARGITEASAKSQASRIRSLLKNADQMEALKRGEVSVRAAIKNTASARPPTAQSKQKAFDTSLAKFAEAAKALGQSKATILATVEAKLDEAKIK